MTLMLQAWNTQNLMELSLNGPVGQVYALVVSNDMLFAGTQVNIFFPFDNDLFFSTHDLFFSPSKWS